MNHFVVWLDSETGHVFALKESGIEKSVVNKESKNHHTRHKNDRHQDAYLQDYHLGLAEKIKNADQVLLMGPGLGKYHFKQFLDSNRSGKLGKKIVGLENMESFRHKTEKQMLAKAHKFFRSYHMFHSSI